jgi:hypothetical protein
MVGRIIMTVLAPFDDVRQALFFIPWYGTIPLTVFLAELLGGWVLFTELICSVEPVSPRPRNPSNTIVARTEGYTHRERLSVVPRSRVHFLSPRAKPHLKAGVWDDFLWHRPGLCQCRFRKWLYRPEYGLKHQLFSCQSRIHCRPKQFYCRPRRAAQLLTICAGTLT